MVENERKDDNTGDSGGKSPKKLRVLLRTFGCQMNEYDSELIESILTDAGFVFAKELKDAEIILLNTCAVRENASRKIFNHVDDIRHALKGKKILIGVLGCVATHLKETIIEKRKSKIDFIVGPDSYRHLPEIITKALNDKKKIADIQLSKEETYSDITPTRKEGINAWLAIMRGCDNFCSYCVVPYTRGRERSRTIENVVEEAQKLAQEGFSQVTLLGQNVNSYQDKNNDFADLLEEISHIKAIKRIRFMSPHPKDFPEKLIEVMAKNNKICQHIHLPMQSGNSRILKLMNRGYTKEEYLALVEKIYTRIPDITLTTDIIVGFPTETDQDFNDTIDVMKKARFASSFIFKYSPRQGTLASKKYPDDITQEKKTERIMKLNALQKRMALERNKTFLNQILPVLVETTTSEKSSNEFQARTDGNMAAIIPQGKYKPGDILNIKITEASSHWIKGMVA